MKSNKHNLPVDEPRRKDLAFEEIDLGYEPKRWLWSLAAWSTALVAITIVGALLFAGCGGQHAEQAQKVSAEPAVTQSGGSAPVVLAKTDQAAPVVQDETPGSTADSPDVTASVSDTLVAPGQSVEITARATSDVTAIELRDGLHEPQAFTYDEKANLWRASYRMPLRSASRVGLGVKAVNETNHWSRVWVFLTPRQEESQSQHE